MGADDLPCKYEEQACLRFCHLVLGDSVAQQSGTEINLTRKQLGPRPPRSKRTKHAPLEKVKNFDSEAENKQQATKKQFEIWVLTLGH